MYIIAGSLGEETLHNAPSILDARHPFLNSYYRQQYSPVLNVSHPANVLAAPIAHP